MVAHHYHTFFFSLKAEIDFISNVIINSIRVFIFSLTSFYILSSILFTISILNCLEKARLISKVFKI